MIESPGNHGNLPAHQRQPLTCRCSGRPAARPIVGKCIARYFPGHVRLQGKGDIQPFTASILFLNVVASKDSGSPRLSPSISAGADSLDLGTAFLLPPDKIADIFAVVDVVPWVNLRLYPLILLVRQGWRFRSNAPSSSLYKRPSSD